jgi:hypothetical protein
MALWLKYTDPKDNFMEDSLIDLEKISGIRICHHSNPDGSLLNQKEYSIYAFVGGDYQPILWFDTLADARKAFTSLANALGAYRTISVDNL